MHHFKHVEHGDVLEFLVLHLVQHPDREPLYQLEQWAADHNVGHLWDCAAEAFDDDRIGRTLKALASNAQEIHEAVVTAVLARYPIDPAILHWDLTHVAFTDARRETELVRAGYGDGQVHERQVKLSMHVTSDCSLPVAYELLPGNAQQQPRAKSQLEKLQRVLHRQDLTIVTDRGGIGYDIIADYKQAGAHYVSCLQLTQTQRKLVADLPLSAFEPSAYRSSKYPDGRYWYHATVLQYTHQKRSGPMAVRAVVIHSERKQASDHKQRQDQIKRTMAKLQGTSEQLNHNRFVSGEYVRKLLKKQVPKAVADLVHCDLSGPDGELKLHAWVDEEAVAEAAKLDGRYLLVYDLPAQNGCERAFGLYKRQYLVESRFRNVRSDLAVNPVWLHRDDHIAGLMLVYVLALMVLCLLGLAADRAGLEGDYYHRMTGPAMLRRFTHLQADLVRARGQPEHIDIALTPEQIEVISALCFQEPQRYLIGPTRR